jgi:predicted ester cyclase
MSLEENKRIVREYIQAEVKEAAEIDTIVEEALAPDFAGHAPEFDQPLNVEQTKQYYREFFRGFPDLKAVVEDIVAEGDKVAVRYRAAGTHTGEFGGIEPTGRTVTFDNLEIYRVVDGKIVEQWAVYDRYSMLVQLGVISEAEAA